MIKVPDPNVHFVPATHGVTAEVVADTGSISLPRAPSTPRQPAPNPNNATENKTLRRILLSNRFISDSWGMAIRLSSCSRGPDPSGSESSEFGGASSFHPVVRVASIRIGARVVFWRAL